MSRRKWFCAGVFAAGLVLLGFVTCGETQAPKEKQPKEIKNSIGMKLVLVPAGKFTMGSPKDEKERSTDEQQHDVEITKAFFVGVYEVTQKQFREVMGYNPSYFSKDGKGREGLSYVGNSEPGGGKDRVEGLNTDDFPVENVSWLEAVEFCNKLSALEEKQGHKRVCRLPSEAEWEYACRGGPASSSKPFHFKSPSDALGAGQANFDARFPYGSGKKGEEPKRTNTVGKTGEPNALGLFDMHGNVWEWCSDRSGLYRVFRGGSWSLAGHHCRAALSSRGDPGAHSLNIGFRVVCVAVDRAP